MVRSQSNSKSGSVVLPQLKQYKELRSPRKKLVSPQIKLYSSKPLGNHWSKILHHWTEQVSLPFEMICDDIAEEKEFPIR